MVDCELIPLYLDPQYAAAARIVVSTGLNERREGAISPSTERVLTGEDGDGIVNESGATSTLQFLGQVVYQRSPACDIGRGASWRIFRLSLANVFILESFPVGRVARALGPTGGSPSFETSLSTPFDVQIYFQFLLFHLAGRVAVEFNGRHILDPKGDERREGICHPLESVVKVRGRNFCGI